jgi:hypothetical protein
VVKEVTYEDYISLHKARRLLRHLLHARACSAAFSRFCAAALVAAGS